MNRERVVWAFIVAIPSAVIGLLPLAFPDIIIWVIGGLITFWLGCIMTWLTLKIKSLESQLVDSQTAQKSEESHGWENLETIDLFLEGWKASQIFEFKRGDRVRVTSSGPKRFILHLAQDITAKRFRSIRKTSETRNWTGTWDIELEGSYAIVAEPGGGTPFWVTVRIDRKSDSFPTPIKLMNH